VVARQHTLLCESIVALQARSHTVECLTRFAQTTSNNIGNSWPHDVSRATTPQQHNSKATRKRHKGGGRGREELYATGTTRGGGNNNDERATTTTTRRSNSVGKVFQLLADITIHTMSLLLACFPSLSYTHTQYNTHSTTHTVQCLTTTTTRFMTTWLFWILSMIQSTIPGVNPLLVKCVCRAHTLALARSTKLAMPTHPQPSSFLPSF
jgi:hypothetical protein